MGIGFDQQIINGANKTPHGKFLSWAGLIPKSSSKKSETIDFNKKDDNYSRVSTQRAQRFSRTTSNTQKPAQKPTLMQRFKNWWNGKNNSDKSDAISTAKKFSDIKHSDGLLKTEDSMLYQ